MLRKTLLLILLFSKTILFAQTISIPAYTGYAIPAEKGDQVLFSEKNGLEQWIDLNQRIQYFFYVHKPGRLMIKLDTKNANAGSIVNVSIAGYKFPVKIPQSNKFKPVNVGMVNLKDTGFFSIELSGLKKSKLVIADLRSIILSGAPVENAHYNPKSRRNAASVHLRYPLEDTLKAFAFYNEITIPKGFDHLHSYYMACGFARGYFGIQVNSEKERRVIFSVWDAGKEAVDRKKVADSNKVQLIGKGEDVFADGFGNEGTGGHSHWVYDWKTEQTYKFLVTVLPDSAAQTTTYAGYFYLPELQKWKLIASFKAPKDGLPLRNLYSFNENFWGNNGQLERKALFGNQWVQNERGQWVELTKSTFSYDATGKAGDRIDYGGGVMNGQFYLSNGGFISATAKFGDVFNRKPTGQRPQIDWNKNADSLAQAAKDHQMIFDAIRSKKLDTTGSKDGIYYQIIKEGTGESVSVNDTVTLNYKGTLLKDGSVFDQTKDKPATFPLKRLIRGWQVGVPLCREGGKIRLIIPSAMGYSLRVRSKAIPPNSVLIFEIEVLKTKKG